MRIACEIIKQMAHKDFYLDRRMHSADYAVARCLSVRLSVCLSHAGIVSKRLYISSKFFTTGGPTILVFFHTKRDGDIPTGPPKGGVECKTGMKKSRFSTNISLYLKTDAR